MSNFKQVDNFTQIEQKYFYENQTLKESECQTKQVIMKSKSATCCFPPEYREQKLNLKSLYAPIYQIHKFVASQNDQSQENELVPIFKEFMLFSEAYKCQLEKFEKQQQEIIEQEEQTLLIEKELQEYVLKYQEKIAEIEGLKEKKQEPSNQETVNNEQKENKQIASDYEQKAYFSKKQMQQIAINVMIQMLLKDENELKILQEQIQSNGVLNSLKSKQLSQIQFKDFLKLDYNPLLKQAKELVNIIKLKSKRKSRNQLQIGQTYPNTKKVRKKKQRSETRSVNKNSNIKLSDKEDQLYYAESLNQSNSISQQEISEDYTDKEQMFSYSNLDKLDKYNSTATFGEQQPGQGQSNFEQFEKLIQRIPQNNLKVKLKRSENLEEQIVTCFEKFISQPVEEGVGILPDTVIDKTIDEIYQYWLSNKTQSFVKNKHIGILLYNYFFDLCKKDRKETQQQFIKFVESIKTHKDVKLKINIFAQFLGIINPLDFEKLKFYLFGLKFIQSGQGNKVNFSFGDVTSKLQASRRKRSLGLGKIKSSLKKINKSQKQNQVSPIGLFYLVKYVYEGNLVYTELDQELEKLKNLFRDKPQISYDKIFKQLTQFQTEYQQCIAKFLKMLWDIMNFQKDKEIYFEVMGFVLQRLDRSYFTKQNVEKLFSTQALRKANKFKKTLDSGITQGAFVTVLMASKLINKRSVQLFLLNKMEIKKNFKTFTDIWENADERFIEQFYHKEKLLKVYINNISKFARENENSKNFDMQRKALIIMKLLS